jgi:hypothetical protein
MSCLGGRDIDGKSCAWEEWHGMKLMEEMV